MTKKLTRPQVIASLRRICRYLKPGQLRALPVGQLRVLLDGLRSGRIPRGSVIAPVVAITAAHMNAAFGDSAAGMRTVSMNWTPRGQRR